MNTYYCMCVCVVLAIQEALLLTLPQHDDATAASQSDIYVVQVTSMTGIAM